MLAINISICQLFCPRTMAGGRGGSRGEMAAAQSPCEEKQTDKFKTENYMYCNLYSKNDQSDS